jgi:hypothetical protein
MKYLSWAAFYEGATDALYMDVLLPRVIRDIVARKGVDIVEVPDVPVVRLGQNGRSVSDVAAEACAFREAVDVLFIHADTGGRAIAQTIELRANAYCRAVHDLCAWPADNCVTITPRHETEAWLLADGLAVTGALGYTGLPSTVGLPASANEAEGLVDPKQVLNTAIRNIVGRRRNQSLENLFPAIAQRQNLNELRQSPTFMQFENRLLGCLQSLRIIHDG